MAHAPNAEMVAVAWAKAIPGVDASKVATSLPGDVTAWAATGFVQVTAVGGSPEVHTGLRRPVVTFDCWAATPGSQRPPWGKAATLAERVFSAFYDETRLPALVSFGDLDYPPVHIRTGWPVTEPRKFPGDPSGFARVMFDAQLIWGVAV